MKADELYAQVTADLVRQIEEGAGSWEMPWKRLTQIPKSISTGKPYRGINLWVLGLTAQDRGWASQQWGTFDHWEKLGFYVQKGEKATKVFWWSPKTQPSKKALAENPDAKPYLLDRVYNVFAREQTDAPPLPPDERLTEHERHEQAEAFFAEIGADVHHGGDRAFYAPVQDFIQVPLIGQFPVRDHYYSTLAHEHTHWTGHKTRLDRDLSGRFGSESYAMEELCAELGAAFIGAQLGLDQAARKDHASYLKSWLKVLKADPKALLTVTSKAQKALDHLNTLANVQPDRELETV